MKAFGRDIVWREKPDTRSLEQVTVADIGLAFENTIDRLTGMVDTAVPAVYRARQIIADTVAALPMDEVEGRTVVEQTSPLLTDPNPELSYHDVQSESVLSLIDDGNTFLIVTNRDSRGNPTRVHVPPPEEVHVEWADKSRMFRNYEWNGKGYKSGIDIVHIALNRKPGQLRGKGPIAAAADTTLAAAQAEEVVARDLARDNYTPSVVIKHPDVKTKDDAERVRDMWMADRAANRKLPSVMNSLAELEQMTFKPIDAQWIEGRNFTVQQIGRLFGLHGFFLLVDSGSSLTYSTTESLFRLFLTATLRPTYLERIEQGWSRLLPSGRSARFSANEILRADIVSRFQAHQAAITSGFKTVNEVRAEEGLSAIAGGDALIAVSTQPKPLPNRESVALNGA